MLTGSWYVIGDGTAPTRKVAIAVANGLGRMPRVRSHGSRGFVRQVFCLSPSGYSLSSVVSEELRSG